ncbi:hypothetical protein KIN20_037374 [Parelaphostrongylus tenuis]|uniref:Uncharacterized protein n=1 Tax=Parelaphostrongylus tenuis TaxID=148309 RepID=A0AAD5REN2_PARTN|nr:hypothetical protein KIN20_037374 [Parelaphostrongylus tenuis]
MARYLTALLMLSLFATISALFGCGVMPAARTMTFTVTGFTLPVAMVYTETPEVFAKVPRIAARETGAKAFVQRLVMQTVLDVESQGRSALLPDAVAAKPDDMRKRICVYWFPKKTTRLLERNMKKTIMMALRLETLNRCYFSDHKHHYGELVKSDVAKRGE